MAATDNALDNPEKLPASSPPPVPGVEGPDDGEEPEFDLSEEEGEEIPPGVPFMAAGGGRLSDEMPESLRNAPPPKPPPDFSSFRKNTEPATAPAPAPEPPVSQQTDYDPFEDDDEDMDLLAFLRQWQYSPGLSYISVRRASPISFRNFTTGGYLEDVHDPFDESWLAQRWGGGSFIVDVFQFHPGSGRSSRVDGRPVSISGPPIAYRGPSGVPAPIPGMQQPQGDGEGWQQPPYGAPVPSPYAQPSGGWGNSRPGQPWQPRPQGGGNAVDLLQRNQQDVQVMGMVKETVETAAQGQVSAVQAQAETLRRELDRERQEVRRARDKEGSSMAAMWGPVQNTIAGVQDQLRTQAAGFQTQLDSQRASHGDELRAREESHRREMEQLRLTNTETLRSRDDDHRRYMDDLRDRHRHEVDGLREEVRRADDRAKERVTQTEQMILARFESQLALAKDAAERAERDADRRTGERDAEIQRMRDELASLRAEKAKGLSSNLAEFAGVMTSFNTVAENMGLSKASGPDGDIPKDTLGKLLHYAPSIGQHVVEPVAKRVEGLTAAIRERNAVDGAVVQQQAAAQQNQALAALPMAAMPPGASMPLPSQQVVYPPIQAPPPVEAPSTPAPAPAPTPEEQAQVSEAEEAQQQVQALFDLLHTRLDEEAAAAATAAELRAVVPAMQIDILKAMDTPQLLAEIRQIAPESPLNTPRGQQWLQGVHAAVKGA